MELDTNNYTHINIYNIKREILGLRIGDCFLRFRENEKAKMNASDCLLRLWEGQLTKKGSF